jgi:hypothetical protein
VLKKSLIAALACSVALAFSPISTAGAATLFGPGTKVQTEQLVDLANTKKKAKKAPKAKKAAKAKKGKAAKSKAGACGTYSYYSKKAKKCVDARAKK